MGEKPHCVVTVNNHTYPKEVLRVFQVGACLQETGELKLEFLEQQAWVKTKRALLGRVKDIF